MIDRKQQELIKSIKAEELAEQIRPFLIWIFLLFIFACIAGCFAIGLTYGLVAGLVAFCFICVLGIIKFWISIKKTTKQFCNENKEILNKNA
jgi:hypothetical protein